MYPQTAEVTIAKYPLEPDDVVGNKIFRIQKDGFAGNYKRSGFLVPHRKDYYFLAFVKKGCSRHWVDEVPYTLRENTFYFTIPQQVHLKEQVEPLTGTIINFTEEFLAMDDSGTLKNLPVIRNPHNGHELLLTVTDVVFIDDIMDKIAIDYHSKESWQQHMLMAHTKVLLIYLSRLYTEQFTNAASSPGRKLLKTYLARIEQSYTEVHDVAAYAGMMNISAGHLSELVKEQSGKPAIVHIHERIVLEAKRLLFHTEQSVKEIAFALGFEDASYFSRFFKRLTDLTPAAYRSNIREMYH
jgi:AraC family transcriptional activator of pobA